MSTNVTMPPAPPPPAQISPGEESIAFIQAMSDPVLQQRLLEAEQQYRPQYNQLYLADINQFVHGSGGQMGLLELQRLAAQEASNIEQSALSQQRAADIADVEALGSRASSAFLQANPQLASSLAFAESLRSGGGMTIESQIQSLVNAGMTPAEAANVAQTQLGAGLQTAGMGQLQSAAGEDALNQAGLDFLNRGGNLSDTQRRNVEQQSRAASVARGRGLDNSSITNEVANRLTAELDLERQNVALGAALLGQGFGMEQQRLSTASGIYGQDLAREQQNAAMQQQTALANQQAQSTQRGMDLQALLGLGQLQQQQLQADRGYALGLVGAQQATASDPFQAILGRPSQAAGMGMAQSQFGANLALQPMGPQLFDPNAGINLALQQQQNMANYQSSIYGSQAGVAGANAQAKGAMLGGLFAGLGALGG